MIHGRFADKHARTAEIRGEKPDKGTYLQMVNFFVIGSEIPVGKSETKQPQGSIGRH